MFSVSYSEKNWIRDYRHLAGDPLDSLLVNKPQLEVQYDSTTEKTGAIHDQSITRREVFIQTNATPLYTPRRKSFHSLHSKYQ